MKPSRPERNSSPINKKSAMTILLLFWLVAWGLHVSFAATILTHELGLLDAKLPASFTISNQSGETLLITPIAGIDGGSNWRGELPILSVTDDEGQMVSKRVHYPLMANRSMTFRFNAANPLLSG